MWRMFPCSPREIPCNRPAISLLLYEAEKRVGVKSAILSRYYPAPEPPFSRLKAEKFPVNSLQCREVRRPRS
jgi:hypothetical protein